MALGTIVAALGILAAGSPVAAAQQSPISVEAAPPGTPQTRYCMRVEFTGSRIDKIRCWTRQEWAEQGVDVDKEWAEEGVRIIA